MSIKLFKIQYTYKEDKLISYLRHVTAGWESTWWFRYLQKALVRDICVLLSKKFSSADVWIIVVVHNICLYTSKNGFSQIAGCWTGFTIRTQIKLLSCEVLSTYLTGLKIPRVLIYILSSRIVMHSLNSQNNISNTQGSTGPDLHEY